MSTFCNNNLRLNNFVSFFCKPKNVFKISSRYLNKMREARNDVMAETGIDDMKYERRKVGPEYNPSLDSW